MLPPAKKKSGLLKWILIAVVVLIVIAFIAASGGEGGSKATGKPVDPEVTLDQAEANIISSGDGVAYSNSDAGNALAKKFSALFKEVAMEGTDTIGERQDFIVHCQLNEQSALFLVHVPKLRKFEKESKERFCEFGWQIAHAVLAESQLTPGSQLAVGVKGLALYQNIYFGTYNPAQLEDSDMGVREKTKSTDALEEFFGIIPTPTS